MNNWREFPFVRLLIPLILGMLLGIYVDTCFSNLHILLFILVGTLLFLHFYILNFSYRWVGGLLIYICFLLIGFQLATQCNELHDKNHFKKHIGNQNSFVGTIIEMPVFKNKTQLVLDIQQIKQGHQWVTCTGKLLVYQELDTLSAQLNYGDVILCHGRLNRIVASGNPYAFDFSRYNHFKNIHYQTYLNFEQWELMNTNNGWVLFHTAFDARKRFIATLKQHLKTPNEFAVGSALILGYKDVLTADIRNAYTATGAMHVLAVSGLHVGIIAYLLSLIIKLFHYNSRYWKFFKAAYLISGIWFFAILTGGSPSVTRAATMFSFLVLGHQLELEGNIYNSIAASAFFLLCYNPFIIADIGFQLSYLAVIGIVFFQPKIYKLWYIKNKIGNYFWKLTTVALAAQIATLPISLFYFHQFPVYFFLSGLVVVPAAIIILGSGILLFLLEMTIPTLAAFVGTALYWFIWGVNSIIFFIQQMPWSLITGIWIGVLGMTLLYLMVVGMMIFIQNKQSKWMIFSMACLGIFSVFQAFDYYKSYTQPALTIYHINKKSIVDFIQQPTTTTLLDESITENQVRFTTQNNRWANHAKFIDHQSFDNLDIENNNLIKHGNLLQYLDKKILIVDDYIDFDNFTIDTVDILYLKNSPAVNLLDLTQSITPEVVVFDGSNSSKRVADWIALCQEFKIPFHDTRSMGAFVVEFESLFKN